MEVKTLKKKSNKNKEEWKIRIISKKWFGSLLRRRILIIFLLIAQIVFVAYPLISGSAASKAIYNCLSILSFAAVLHVVSAENKKGAFKLLWTFLILLFPLFGGVLYIMVNFQSSTKRFQSSVARYEEKSRGYTEIHGDGYNDAIEQIPEMSSQINYLQNNAGFPVYSQSNADFLSSGKMKLKALLQELEKAEKYIKILFH